LTRVRICALWNSYQNCLSSIRLGTSFSTIFMKRCHCQVLHEPIVQHVPPLPSPPPLLESMDDASSCVFVGKSIRGLPLSRDGQAHNRLSLLDLEAAVTTCSRRHVDDWPWGDLTLASLIGGLKTETPAAACRILHHIRDQRISHNTTDE